jgi:hypothetical protein
MAFVALSNPPLQRLNATPVRVKVGVCRDAARWRARLLPAVVRSNATLAFTAERQVVGQMATKDAGGGQRARSRDATGALWSAAAFVAIVAKRSRARAMRAVTLAHPRCSAWALRTAACAAAEQESDRVQA